MNGYAAVAFATPVAALALGWLAVAWHRRSLRCRPSPDEQAERQARRERVLDEQLAAIEARADDLLRKAALARAELEQEVRERDERRASPGTGAVAAG